MNTTSLLLSALSVLLLNGFATCAIAEENSPEDEAAVRASVIEAFEKSEKASDDFGYPSKTRACLKNAEEQMSLCLGESKGSFTGCSGNFTLAEYHCISAYGGKQ